MSKQLLCQTVTSLSLCLLALAQFAQAIALATAEGSSSNSNAVTDAAVHNNGFTVVAQALAKLGIKHMYGVVGIPVTELASAAQVYMVTVLVLVFDSVAYAGCL